MEVLVHTEHVRTPLERVAPEPDIIFRGVRFGMRDIRDEVLVGRVARSGDERALSELYDRYSAQVFGLGVRYLGDRSVAEDLVQEVFVSVWRNAASFDPTRASFATWMFRIVRNRATDLIRRRRARVRTVNEAFSEPVETDPSSALLRGLEAAAALSGLAPDHREVLFLAYFRGLSQREISELTGVPLGTVKSRTSAALRVLRERLITEPTDHE
jgi:RNA polymerase sigma factor (sigma-70 family)